MAKKTSEQHQANSRLGALGESFVQTFLLEHCDWCYKTQEKHPADLVVELGSAKYTIQVKSRRETKKGKHILFKPNNTTQTYFTFDASIITPTLAMDSFKDTLDQLSSVPKINPLLK